MNAASQAVRDLIANGVAEPADIIAEAKRIHQDLVEEGFTGSYHSVCRFVQALGRKRPLPFRRLESPLAKKPKWTSVKVFQFVSPMDARNALTCFASC